MNRPVRPRPEIAWQFGKPTKVLELAAEWDALVVGNGYPTFLGATFINHAVEAFGCERGLTVCGRIGNRLVATGVIVRHAGGRWVCFQPSQLPLGAWVMDRQLSWGEVLPSLISALPGLGLSVSLTRQDPKLVGRPNSVPAVEILDYVETGWIEVEGSFEDFWQSRGKNLRQNLRKQRRKLEEQGQALTFDYLTKPADVDAAFVEFAALESAGWKAAEGSAICVDNNQGLFYRKLLADFAARGEAFAFLLSLSGKPIAVDFGVRDPDTMVILKTTYDETLKAVSPAQLLHERAFELVFRDRLARHIEFYGRVMEWHQRWTDQSRMLFHVNSYRWPFLRELREFTKRLVPPNSVW